MMVVKAYAADQKARYNPQNNLQLSREQIQIAANGLDKL